MTIKWCRFLRYWAWQTEFFVILDYFLPFYLPNNPKYQNFGKIKKTPGGIIILHMCTINDNHMMYGSWDIERDKQFFVILDNFLPIYLLKTWKIKILKKWDIIILHKCTTNHDHMLYCYWDMVRDRCNYLGNTSSCSWLRGTLKMTWSWSTEHQAMLYGTQKVRKI